MEVVTKSEAINSQLKLFDIYKRTHYLSVKHDSYFQVYDTIFRQYIDQPITFVEVGVQSGGSLFMWRDYLGPSARIIGVDINPASKKWEKEGFEIFIGDQSDPDFWDRFYKSTGPIDVLLDDGGHTNSQQIITSHKAMANIKDGGKLVVEDVHTSYMTMYGNPSKYSFVNFSKRVIDSLNSRCPDVKTANNDYGKKVFSVAFYESIVVFNIDSKKCFISSPSSNNGIKDPDTEDMWNKNSVAHSYLTILAALREAIPRVDNVPFARKIALKLYRVFNYLFFKIKSRELATFFK